LRILVNNYSIITFIQSEENTSNIQLTSIPSDIAPMEIETPFVESTNSPFSTETESQHELESEEIQIDKEDYEGVSLDDAYNDLQHPQTVIWPNEAYREFVEITTKYQLSNSAGDAIIRFFNKFSKLDDSPLPSSTKVGKELLDNANIRYMMFKEVSITIFQDNEYILHYRPVIQAIKSLLVIENINQNLVLDYKEKREIRNSIEYRLFEEQYNCNWWRREELKLAIGQRLLSIIIYSDATTLDHMGKSSGHPIFLSLGNIPNFQRNKPESKALIGYLPILKAKDSKTKNSESFRKLQRTVFQRSLTILLKPILNCPELQFVVRRNVISFIPRISVILADLAEVNKFTNIYQPSTSKKPCSSCLISKIDLNNTELTDLSLRTPQNMKQEIENGQAHENSIHTEHNIFWEIRYQLKFLLLYY
jgi:hypothetical protein